jgi:hypothetical protein
LSWLPATCRPIGIFPAGFVLKRNHVFIFVFEGGFPMRLAHRFAVLFLALLLASLLGCASTAKQEGTGQYFDDSVITTKVKAALFKEDSLKSTQITVETFKGTVELSGFVATQQEIDKAVEVARKVEGVVDVKNALHLK